MSFKEICDQFEWARGDHIWASKEKNIVWWIDIAEDLPHILWDLYNEKRIDTKRVSPLVYMMDGQTLEMTYSDGKKVPAPIVSKTSRIPKAGYKKLHWEPMVWSIAG